MTDISHIFGDLSATVTEKKLALVLQISVKKATFVI